MTEIPKQRIHGRPGELTDRLINALQAMHDASADWSETAYLTLAIALSLDLSTVDGEPQPVLNTSAVKEGIRKATAIGIDEAFLITACRDQIARAYKDLSDTPRVNQNRRRIERYISELYSDPDKFRAHASKSRPGREESKWTDEQVRKANEQRSKIRLAPLTAEDSARAWKAFETWLQTCESTISDEIIEVWRIRTVAR